MTDRDAALALLAKLTRADIARFSPFQQRTYERLQAEAAEPEVAEPEAAEPEGVAPEATASESAEPEVAEPEAGAPEAVAPRREVPSRKPVAEASVEATSVRRFSRLSDAVQESVRWLWEPRIPMGSITLLEGNPGEGKSLLTQDLAARITTGREMPDQAVGLRGGAVLVGNEDLDSVIQTRVAAAGGDLEEIVSLGPDDFASVTEACRDVKAQLVVIDPLFEILPRGVDFRLDPEVRRFLAPLLKLAREEAVAVVAIRHLTKDDSRKSRHRGQGSVAFGGVARSVLGVDTDPQDPDGYLLAQIKTNYGVIAPSLRYRIVDASTGVPRVDWVGPSEYSADDARTLQAEEYASPSRLRDAIHFLQQELAAGPVKVTKVHEHAESVDVAYGTLRRARESIGVVARKRGGISGDQWWEWSLPENEGDQTITHNRRSS